MNEVKNTLKRMVIYYLLFAINIIPSIGFIVDNFPTRNLVAIYLLILSVCLVLYYSHRVSPTGGFSSMMKILSWMGLLLILFRVIKYSAFSEVDVLARHTWYFYYVPILLLPLFLFYISLMVAPNKKSQISKFWHWTLAITVIFIALVLSNDIHQQIFKFNDNFANWDNDYTHGWLFYVLNVWQFGLYIGAIIILIIKCSVSGAKKSAWIMLIPVGIGVVLYSLLFTGNVPKINGSTIFEFPETHIFTIAVVLECCMQLGLIPTNTEYGKLFKSLSISAQITDTKGMPIFASAKAIPIKAEQFELDSGARIGEHTILHKMPLSGGYGFWQDDMTELDRLNDELSEAKEGLSQEAELIRLKNELKERQTKILQRTLVYDAIAKRTQRQSQAITLLAENARKSDDKAVKDESRRHITLLGAYIKRYANLMLMGQESEYIEVGELGLSISEVLRYLNYCGIPGEIINSAKCTIHANAALAVFEVFEYLIEANYSLLKGVFVNLSEGERVVFKIIFENLTADISKDMGDKLKESDVLYDITQEDAVTYITFTMPKGGEGNV